MLSRHPDSTRGAPGLRPAGHGKSADSGPSTRSAAAPRAPLRRGAAVAQLRGRGPAPARTLAEGRRIRGLPPGRADAMLPG